MKIPKPSTNVVDPRIDLVPSWKEASIGAMERGIQSKKVREDYRELCNLSLFYLTGNLRQPIKKPGAFHHARWMAKAIYVLKIRMFRSHVQMTTREGKGLEEIALFVVLLYSRAWMEAGLATEAAYNDLNLVKDLHHFQEINGAIWKTTLTTFSRHLWYLGADSRGACLFSRRGSAWRRRRRLLKRRGRKRTSTESGSTRLRISSSTPRSPHSPPAPLFARSPSSTSTSPSFPSLWTSGKQTLRTRRGVHSEEPQRHKRRGRAWVAMISSYNDSLTKDEKTKQDLLRGGSSPAQTTLTPLS
ncbi:hypothetical protein GWK47_017376 [Chionoecetes opilio]|uniref:Uncharacterized protein n=1 Tax=Chionoecetes opilio TaxID=41210 RepID=A0A8J4XQY8_CHIOP|nr:hypothetical protein GWK47_017376 [Chionoecetes opilio]